MNLYIKQKVFSWKDRFDIFDESMSPIYNVCGEILSFGKKLHLYSPNGTEVAFIHQKVLSWLPCFFISKNGVDVTKVTKKISFLHPKYVAEELGWTIIGDFLSHEYTIEDDHGKIIASITKKWLSWSDTYQINITTPSDEINVVCIVLIIDAVMAMQAASASTISSN